MGTVISESHLERIQNCVDATKGKIIAGGKRMTGLSALDGTDLSKGAFYPPTVVVDIPLTDELWTEEVFGPVVVVRKFSVSVLIRHPFLDALLRVAC